ncbi:hypothetical protein [Azospirillum sp.]|uniref:hypothetical protein n=1 Tax=Azospirillum sp. TaxID=34012 RepID=UPI003D7091AE
MPTIVLHGALKREFGGPFFLDVRDAAEAFRALEANFPGRFFAAVRDGVYKIVRGHPRTGMQLGEDELRFGLGGSDLHVMPLPRGSGNKGGVKVVIGIAIIAVAIIAAPPTGGTSLAAAMQAEASIAGVGIGVSYGAIAKFGVMMALAGVSQMLSPQPKARSLEAVDKRQSYLFSGPVNLTEQGGAVPLIYGRCRVGSTVVSASIDTEAVEVDTPTSAGLTIDAGTPTMIDETTAQSIVHVTSTGAYVDHYRIAAITIPDVGVIIVGEGGSSVPAPGHGALTTSDGTALGVGATVTKDQGADGLIWTGTHASITVTAVSLLGADIGTGTAEVGPAPNANTGGIDVH